MGPSLVLFEDDGFVDLLPLVFWRCIFELQVGRKILLDRTAQRLNLPVSGVWTRDWMAKVAAQRCGAPANQPIREGAILVNGRWVFDEPVEFPRTPGVGMIDDQAAYIIADPDRRSRLTPADLLDPQRRDAALKGLPRRAASGRLLRYPWEIVADLHRYLDGDFLPSDATIESELDPALSVTGRERLHVGENTRIHPTAVIDATSAVYVGHDVAIGPYSVLEGPLYVGPGCRVNAHAWLHGGNSIGPVCRVGGEMVGSVMHGYSNKQHHGFLGHAIVGSWVNLGAGASNSNLKNTYGRVRVPLRGREVDTGLQFFGAIIADHAKIGINAAIPTGGVVGMGAGVVGTRVLPKFVPSFGWVTDDGIGAGDPMRALDVASAVMARRNVDMTDDEVELFLDLGNRFREYEHATGRARE